MKQLTPETIEYELARLDWKRILKEAIEIRPTSWHPNAIREWRNASDCLWGAVCREMRRKKLSKDPLRAVAKKLQQAERTR